MRPSDSSALTRICPFQSFFCHRFFFFVDFRVGSVAPWVFSCSPSLSLPSPEVLSVPPAHPVPHPPHCTPCLTMSHRCVFFFLSGLSSCSFCRVPPYHFLDRTPPHMSPCLPPPVWSFFLPLYCFTVFLPRSRAKLGEPLFFFRFCCLVSSLLFFSRSPLSPPSSHHGFVSRTVRLPEVLSVPDWWYGALLFLMPRVAIVTRLTPYRRLFLPTFFSHRMRPPFRAPSGERFFSLQSQDFTQHASSLVRAAPLPFPLHPTREAGRRFVEDYPAHSPTFVIVFFPTFYWSKNQEIPARFNRSVGFFLCLARCATR